MGLFRKKQKDNPIELEMKSLAEKAVEHGKRFNYDFDYKRESIEELEEVLITADVGVGPTEKIIDGLRGKGGGYRLNRDASEYSVGEILRLTEGSLAPVSCLDCKPNKCERAAECRTLPMWEKLDTIISDYLDHVSIADLLDSSAIGDFQI